jgi:hypothetical protein
MKGTVNEWNQNANLECSGLAELSFSFRVSTGILVAMKKKAVTSPRTPENGKFGIRILIPGCRILTSRNNE